MEQWKDVVGFEEHFRVSNTGRVWSKRTNKELVLGVSKTGYSVLSTRVGGRKGKCYCLKVHRLVAEAFLPPPKKYQVDWAEVYSYKTVQVNHKDGNKLNNNVENLEWCTNSENVMHSYNELNPTIPYGEDRHNSKLSEGAIVDIRSNCVPRSRDFGFRAFARKYGVNKQTVSQVFYKKSWIHV